MPTSRVSFEPTEDTRTSNGLQRQVSATSAEMGSGEEYEAWLCEHPCLLDNFEELEAAAAGKLVAVFLDYDGTLTPIVNNPDAAYMSEHMRNAVRLVATLFPTAIISGRGREKVEQFVQLKELFYAGSHGMDIAGPRTGSNCNNADDPELTFQPAARFEPLMCQVGQELSEAIADIPGSTVENNKYCVSVHFRNCAPESYDAVVKAVEGVAARHDVLHITRGRKVLEVRPHVDWNKGSALLHLLGMLGVATTDVFCLYIGDDRTDEDAFKVLREDGIGAGILVSTRAKPTSGRWTLRDPAQVAAFLNRLVSWGRTDANSWHAKGKSHPLAKLNNSSMHKIIPLLCLLAAATLTTAFGPAWYQCSDATCTGNCHCGSDNPPGGLAPADTPQFVLITHDDAVTGLADHGVRSVTDVHSNTNGCNIPATWFVTQEGSDCSIVQRLFADNHEIALHTVHHYALVPDLPGMEQEIMGVKNYLNATCGIPNEAMVGFRSPYLVTNWVVRGILEQNGFLYDSSIDEYVGPDSPTTQSFGERLWPYTMDFGIAQDCNWTVPSGMCQSTEKYPGLWEIPMWDLPNATVDTENNAYTMDPGPGYGGDVYTTFQTNFDQAYNGNRAPFPIYVHAPWFTPENINATNRFIEYALSKPDVFFVTMQQLINWIKNPVPASQVGATLKCNPVNLTAPTTPSCQVYTVQPGDYIDLIASKFGILNSTDISALNPGSNNLQPGDLLKIPPWNATCGNGIPSNGTEGAAASYGSFSETLPTTPPGPITPATTNPMALPPPEAPTQAQPAPVAETQPAPVAETQPAPVAETQPAPAGQYAANRVEMMMNLAGMDPATFQANTQTQFAIALAQQLKVAPETIALGSGSRRRHRSLLQAQPTTLQVLVVVTTSDPVGVAQQAQRQIENGDFESMLTSLGLTPQGAPTVTAYENNVSVPVPPPTATAPAPPSSSKGLSTGAIVGIAVGGAVALIAIVAVGVVVVRKRRAAKVAQLGNPKLKYIGGEAKLAVKTESQKGANDPFAVVKGGVETPTSPTQRTYFSSV